MTAPDIRLIDQFSGNKFWDAQREADDRIEELKHLRVDNHMLTRQLDALLSTDRAELAARNEELEDEVRELRGIVAGLRDQLATARAAVSAATRRGW